MSVADRWRKMLKPSGYEHTVEKKRDMARAKKFSRSWKKILKHISVSAGGRPSAFEVGCGGGKQIVTLALNGWRCTGLDCSLDVLKRAERYIGQASAMCGRNLDIELIHKDFLEYAGSEKYDLVFHFGVLEHFLDDGERMTALRKMFDMTRPDGYVVSAIPVAKRVNLSVKAGFDGGIPHLDYSWRLMLDEMKACDGRDIEILPHNLFSYVLYNYPVGFLGALSKLYYYAWQCVPVRFLPRALAYEHAGLLIGIARKPVGRL